MQPYTGGKPIGDEAFVSAAAMATVADRMFDAGADEVRVRRRPSKNCTRARSAQQPKRVKRAKRKAAKRARRANR